MAFKILHDLAPAYLSGTVSQSSPYYSNPPPSPSDLSAFSQTYQVHSYLRAFALALSSA